MSTAFLDISAALDVALSTFATAQSIPVAWENVNYTPTVGTKYLRPTLLPGDTLGIGVSNTSTEDHLGVYQVDVICPINEGKGVAFILADAVKTAFPRGNLTYNGVNIRIKSVSRGTGTRDGAWFVVPVEISYQSYT